MPDKILINIPFIYIVFIAAAAIFISLYFYRRTLPAVKPLLRYLLGGLRAAVLFFLMLLFFAPRFLLTFFEAQTPQIAVFVDNSLSMGYRSELEDRWTETQNVVNRLKDIIQLNKKVGWYEFNSAVKACLPESLHVSQGGSNFSAVMRLLQEKNFDKAVLISDGNMTEGAYPLSTDNRSAGELYTIGMGAVSGEQDVFIDDVVYQPLVYRLQRQNIEVKIGSKNIKEKKQLQVRLLEQDKVIAGKVVEIDTSEAEQSLTFEYTPDRLGLNRLQMTLETLKGETNILNNISTFVQEVLKNKLRIGIFSGSVGYENKFLNLVLKSQNNFETYPFVENKAGQFYQNPDPRLMDSLDILILQGYPDAATKDEFIQRLKLTSQKRNPLFIFFLSKKTRTDKLQAFQDFLPFEKLPPLLTAGETERYVESSSGYLSLSLFNDEVLNRQFWSKIPPLPPAYNLYGLKSKAQVLLSGKIKNREIPLIVLFEKNHIRSALFNGEGFWKWHFHLQDEPLFLSGYANLLAQIIRWTAGSARLKPVILETPAKIVHPGERFRLTGYIYDANYSPVSNGSIGIEVKSPDRKFTLDAVNDSSGRYITDFTPTSVGRINIKAEGMVNGQIVGSDQLELEVIPFEKEYIRLSQNVSLLKGLAQTHRGLYFPATQVDSLRKYFNSETKIIQRDDFIEIWYLPATLILIIVLITAEWILRKRYGMV